MDTEIIKKLIKNSISEHEAFIEKARVSECYYKNKNDILCKDKSKDIKDKSLNNADNKISSNYYGFLVNQKASYLFTYPPTFDVGNNIANQSIRNILGDKFAKTCKKLCVDASNCTVAWLHMWKDKYNKFNYAAVDAKQIIPIYQTELEDKLNAVLRIYNQTDFSTGEEYTVYEYWTDKEVHAYKKGILKTLEDIECCNMFSVLDIDSGYIENTNVLSHDFGEVPFIAFYNNDAKIADLDAIKKLIDIYDKIFSRYVENVEDMQDIVLDDKLSMAAMKIDMLVTTRNKLLEIIKEKIFLDGQGVNPENKDFEDAANNTSKHLYSSLELKANLLETEFRLSFTKLIQIICRYLDIKIENITQIWTRYGAQNHL